MRNKVLSITQQAISAHIEQQRVKLKFTHFCQGNLNGGRLRISIMYGTMQEIVKENNNLIITMSRANTGADTLLNHVLK